MGLYSTRHQAQKQTIKDVDYYMLEYRSRLLLLDHPVYLIA